MRPILLVDDDPDVVASMTALLEDAGYSVIAADSGEEALRACSRAPRLVLIDLHLPGPLSGRALVDSLRVRLGYATKFILLTGVHDAVQRASEIGVDGFLEKPYEIATLLRTIERHIQ